LEQEGNNVERNCNQNCEACDRNQKQEAGGSDKARSCNEKARNRN
jgi:hypothetical protein